MEADLLFVDGTPPIAIYRFKHALIQDAAYESLLKSRRQALHRRAADALRHANAEPEAIAHHFTEAGLDDLAIEWWGNAATRHCAARRSRRRSPISARRSPWRTRPPETRNCLRRRGSACKFPYPMRQMQAHGQHASDVRATFLRARELAAAIDESD